MEPCAGDRTQACGGEQLSASIDAYEPSSNQSNLTILASVYFNPLGTSVREWNATACAFTFSTAHSARVWNYTSFSWPDGTLELWGKGLRPRNTNGTAREQLGDLTAEEYALTLPVVELDAERAWPSQCAVIESNDTYAPH